MKPERLQTISLELIDPASKMLRPVDATSSEFLQLADSMRSLGQLQTILVRPIGDGRFEVANGMHRYTAARLLGWTHIECTVREMDDSEYLRAQLEANAQHVDTDPIQYAKRLEELRDMLSEQEGKRCTLAMLAKYTNRSTEWVRMTLGLTRLRSYIQIMVSRGEIPLDNAKFLAKLPTSLQDSYVEVAQRATRRVCRKTISAAINEYRENVRNTRLEAFISDEIVPFVDVEKLKSELKTSAMGAVLLSKFEVGEPIEAWKLAIRWATHLDPDTFEERQQKFRDRELKRFEAADKRKQLLKQQQAK